MTAPPPFSDPVVIDERSRAWLPTPMRYGYKYLVQVHNGCALGWAPIEGGHVLLNIAGGGEPTQPREVYESVAFTLSHAGLEQLIADLQSIADQRDGKPPAPEPISPRVKLDGEP